jgi:phosphoribosylamine---glycine ligase
MMKVLIIGGGGREHAIAWKISQSPLVERIYCAPGNGGTAMESKCINVSITKTNKLLEFALENSIDVTIVGPEAPLVMGIVDKFQSAGVKIFGPCKEAARLEGSKIFAKEFMEKYNVKTAEYKIFEDAISALEHLNNCRYPLVIKADGLASGKGVRICVNVSEARECIENFMVEDIFNGAGCRIIIEKYLEGVEASILAVTDGQTIIPFLSAKDHKTIFENNKGPNTGGMGAICPNPYFTDKIMESFKKDIMNPTINGIMEEKMDYTGIVFFGIMITNNEVYLLEYNVRMGDPETQAILALMDNDFMELIINAMDKKLDPCMVKWRNKKSCCVVASSNGYPNKYNAGFAIKNIDKTDGKLFISGAELKDGTLITSGGRVLSITALGDTFEEARNDCYKNIERINFSGIYYRKDIGSFEND